MAYRTLCRTIVSIVEHAECRLHAMCHFIYEYSIPSVTESQFLSVNKESKSALSCRLFDQYHKVTSRSSVWVTRRRRHRPDNPQYSRPVRSPCVLFKSNQIKSNLLNKKGIESLLQVAQTYKNDKCNRRYNCIDLYTVHNKR